MVTYSRIKELFSESLLAMEPFEERVIHGVWLYRIDERYFRVNSERMDLDGAAEYLTQIYIADAAGVG